MKILSVQIKDLSTIQVNFAGDIKTLQIKNCIIYPQTQIKSWTIDQHQLLLETDTLSIQKNYTLYIPEYGNFWVNPVEFLNSYYSDAPLGCLQENGSLIFRLFAPRAKEVHVELFKIHDEDDGAIFPMSRLDDGTWKVSIADKAEYHFYTYQIKNDEDTTPFAGNMKSIADPYSAAVVTKNNYHHAAKSHILRNPDFDWEEDTFQSVALEDMIVYEMHVRDMTVHESSGHDAELRGTYAGLAQTDKNGGIDYLKSLGINVIELLPVQEFANFEPGFKYLKNAVRNSWNVYARNHWGYMTSYFLAPESCYATGNSLTENDYCGQTANAIHEFKTLVKSLHKAGMAVVLDIVFNHTSEYDDNPFKHVDPLYYYRLDEQGNLSSKSGCGNDFKTERPMARRLIVDTICHWMTEYHVDGFRFDLASMIDEETLNDISKAARKINPDVILIAEPWGGDKYGQTPFSERGWAAWNDWYRNGVKGQNPHHEQGFIFGKYIGNNNADTMKKYILGTPRELDGPYLKYAHSLNYLESHDGYTLGDFVRLALNEFNVNRPVNEKVKLSSRQLAIHKLAALFLFVSRGPIMIHAGQEFARSKIIAPTNAPDTPVGHLDENSYNKDDETNWINYHHAEINKELLNYYRGLITLRKTYTCISRTEMDQYDFLTADHPYAFGFAVHDHVYEFIILLNSHQSNSAHFHIRHDGWEIIVNRHSAGIEMLEKRKGPKISVPAISGMLLRRKLA